MKLYCITDSLDVAARAARDNVEMIQIRAKDLPARALAELVRPAGFEVDGVGQHQPGRCVEHAGRNQILDFVFGLLFDPGIDRLARAFRIVFEIHLLESGAVIGLQQAHEIGKKTITLLPPKGVGDR